MAYAQGYMYGLFLHLFKNKNSIILCTAFHLFKTTTILHGQFSWPTDIQGLSGKNEAINIPIFHIT